MRTRTLHWVSITIFTSTLVLLTLGSVLFNIQDKPIPQTQLLFDESGKLLGSAPFPPSLQFPFGTDRDGYHITHKIFQGAQYTIGAAIIISLFSFVISFLFGIIGGFSKWRITKYTQRIFTSFYFIPQSIIAYNILYPLLWEPREGFTTTLTERIILEMLVLSIIVAPITAILIGNETEQILQEEFITSAKVLGGSTFFIFYKHLMPHLKMRLFVIYPKILIQVLLIIAHLGFFTLFFGGTSVCYEPFCNPPRPIVQEWSSLMGNNYVQLYLSWWIFIVPMLCFTFTILILNSIAKSIERLLETEKIQSAASRNREKHEKTIRKLSHGESFQFYKKEKESQLEENY